MKVGTKNAMRSGLVVIGALAFGYLTLQLGFKPYLEQAQLRASALDQSPPSHAADHHHFDDNTSIIPDDSPSDRNL